MTWDQWLAFVFLGWLWTTGVFALGILVGRRL
jgi:hypothetical protein